MHRHRITRQTSFVLLLVLCTAGATTRAGDDRDAGSPETADCPPDVAPAQGNGMVNIDDLLTVINGWGSCAQPCPPHCAADVTQNCTVNIDDLLAVINAWGNCPCTLTQYEPNDSCATLTTLQTVGSNQMVSITNSALASTSDVDYFKFQCQETDATCSCCDGGFCLDEDYRVTVTLTVPAGGPAYQLCVTTNCSQLAGTCVSVPAGTTGQRMVVLDGACGGTVDAYDMFVRISALAAVTTCQPYQLQYQFEPGCF
jgi:hypothetical protein